MCNAPTRLHFLLVKFDVVNGGFCTSVTKQVCQLIAQSKQQSLMTGAANQPPGCFVINNQVYYNDNLASTAPFQGAVHGFCVKGSAKCKYNCY